MTIYSHEGGYGNIDIANIKDTLYSLPAEERRVMAELLHDYECLRRVIEGKGYIFQHDDGSEVRRIKLY